MWGGAAHAVDFNNSSPQSGTSTLFTLDSGDNLTNSSSITITNGAAPAVRVSPVAAGTITNSGTIASFGSPGTAISVGGTLTSLTNSGLIAADQANSRAVDIPAGGSIAALINLANGTISANGANGIAVNVIGVVGTLTNNTGAVIQANGSNGIAVNVGAGGTIGSLNNSGLVQANGTGGQAIVVNGNLGTLSNGGTILASNGTALVVGANGSISSLQNLGSGLIQGGDASGSGVAIDHSAGTMQLPISNAGTILGQIKLGAGGDAVGNYGLIQSSGSFAISGTSPISGLSNASGRILAPNGVAVSLGSANVIGNYGTGLISGNAGGLIISNGTVTQIYNAGTVQATGANGTGLGLGAMSNLANLHNQGTIQANGASSVGLSVAATGSIATVINAGSALIQASGSGGQAVAVAGSIASLQNIGTVLGGAVGVNDSGNIGTLSNSGPLSASGAAVNVTSTGVLGALFNGSVVQGATAVADAGQIASITNYQTLLGSNTGILVSTGGFLGSLTNQNLIQAPTAVANMGTLLGITNSGTMAGAVINQGLIGNSGTAAIANSGLMTSLVNSGSIIEAGGTALALSGGSISGGIANTKSGLIQGGPSNGSGVAIDNATGSQLTVNTQGTIIGAIRLGTHGDILNVMGGSITGAITGQGTSDSIVYALGNTGSFTTGGSISSVGTINVASGTVNFQNSIASAMAFSVNSGATAMLNPGAPIAAASFNNAGAVSVGTGAATVTGNYTQASTGMLKISVTNTGVGSLGVSGTASIAQPANAVAAHVPTTIIIAPLVGTSFTVLSASGGLSVNNPSALTASSDSAFLSFNLAEVGNTLVLTPRLPTFAESLANIEAAIDSDYTLADGIFPPNANELEGRRFMAYILAGLSSTGQGQLAETYLNILGNLANSPGLLIQLEKAIVPNAITSALLNFAGSVGSFSTSSSNINSRLTMLRSLDTGLAAGDEVARGIQAWIQPFGSFLNQDAKEGIDGYSMSTYGATMGGDMLVTPDLRLGMALTLANNDVSYNGFTSGSKASAFNVQLGLYGQYYIQNFFIDGLLSFGYNKYSSNTQLAAFGLTRNADYGGTQFGAKIGAGYDFKLPNAVVITPYASVQQLHMNFNSYTTTGAFPFNMHVPSASADVTTTSLGVRVAYPVKLSMGTLTPEIHANWFHNFGTDQLATTYSSSDVTIPAPFINAFTFRGPHSDRDVFNIGVSANLAQSGPWTFGAGYDFAGRSSSSQHLFYLRAKYSF